MRGKAAELGRRHVMVAKEGFDLADQHRRLLAREFNKCVESESTNHLLPRNFLLV
jgi:hypothetical protein